MLGFEGAPDRWWSRNRCGVQYSPISDEIVLTPQYNPLDSIAYSSGRQTSEGRGLTAACD